MSVSRKVSVRTMSERIFIKQSNGLSRAGGPRCSLLTLSLSFFLLLASCIVSPVQAYNLNGTAIAENLPAGTPVGTFASFGISIPTYSLPAGAADNASFIIEGNTLKTAVVFNFEAKSLYTLLVLSDMGEEKTFTVTVSNINESPVIIEGNALSVKMDEDGFPAPFSLNLNAADPDGNALTWSILTAAGHGTASVSGSQNSASVAYIPIAGYNGADSFAVQVSDGDLTAAATVYVNVSSQNDSPVIAEGETVTVAMDEDASPLPFSLTLNASDPDNDVLTWSIAGPAANGTAFVSGTGMSKAISYVPNPNYIGADSFTVQVSDGGLTDAVTVNITVAAQNDSPVIAEGESVTSAMDEDGSPLSLTLNASDPDADPLTWEIVTLPENGKSEVIAAENSAEIVYVPKAGYSGSDLFIIEVSDGQLSDTIIVYVNVSSRNDPPVIAEGESVTVTMDENGIPRKFNLTLNASDPDGDMLTWNMVSLPENGEADASGTGNSQAIAYIPDPGYSGKDQFEVRVSDGEFSDTIMVYVSILPRIEGSCSQICEEVGWDNCRLASMDEDAWPQPFKLTLSASDPDNDILTWSISKSALSGTAYAGGTGYTKAIGYTPQADHNGTDRFDVQVSDGELTDSVTVCVTIAAQNDAPRFAGTDTAAAKENELFSYMVITVDPDAGDSRTLTASGLPEWLTLSDKGDGTAILSGSPAEIGKYAFQLQAQDMYGGIAVRDFTVNVSENIGDTSEEPAVSDSEKTDSGVNVSENLGDELAVSDPEKTEDKNMPPEPAVIPLIPGDIDDDGDADLGDAILGLQVLSGMEPYQPVFVTADVNGDGKIGMAEVLYILRTNS